MLHCSIIPENVDLNEYFSLEPCQGCANGCRGSYDNYHCPICPLKKFKPVRRQKVKEHLALHFYKYAVHARGCRITGCGRDCRPRRSLETHRNRTHFHCPFCRRTFTKKNTFTIHIDNCNIIATDEDSMKIDDSSSPFINRIMASEANILDIPGNDSPSKCLEGSDPVSFDAESVEHSVDFDSSKSSLPDKKCRGVLYFPIGNRKGENCTEFTRDFKFPKHEKRKKENVSDSSTVPRVKSSKKECKICHKQYHEKYLNAHVRKMHTEKKKKCITEERYHHAVLVDSDNGIYTVARSLKGPPYPIHVKLKNMGSEDAAQCELVACINHSKEELERGNDSYWCDHLQSTVFSRSGTHCLLLTKKLKEMNRKGLIMKAKYRNCLLLDNKAKASEVPTLVRIPKNPSHSQRYQFFSVYSGLTRIWSRFQRTVVTMDTKNYFFYCRCPLRKDCTHRCIVKWWFFQQSEPNFQKWFQ